MSSSQVDGVELKVLVVNAVVTDVEFGLQEARPALKYPLRRFYLKRSPAFSKEPPF
jgi:hypothetical protein